MVAHHILTGSFILCGEHKSRSVPNQAECFRAAVSSRERYIQAVQSDIPFL